MSKDSFKVKKYGIVYKATNIINNKVYIGQTSRKFSKRINEHIKNKNKRGFSKAIQKHGSENFIFEEIYTSFDRNELDRVEEFFIEKYQSTNCEKGYNLVKYASKSTKGYKHTKESIARMVEGRKNVVYKPHTEETKLKISKSKKGKRPNRDYVVSDETKNKISKTLKEKFKDKEFKEKSCKHLKNPSKKTREKMSKAKKGRKMSLETRMKISNALKGTCNRWKNIKNNNEVTNE